MKAPIANPTRASAPATKPCAQPNRREEDHDADDDPIEARHVLAGEASREEPPYLSSRARAAAWPPNPPRPSSGRRPDAPTDP